MIDITSYFSTILGYGINTLYILTLVAAFTMLFYYTQLPIFSTLEKHNYIHDPRDCTEHEKLKNPLYWQISIVVTGFVTWIPAPIMVMASTSLETFEKSENWYEDFALALAQPYLLALVIGAGLLGMWMGVCLVRRVVKGITTVRVDEEAVELRGYGDETELRGFGDEKV